MLQHGEVSCTVLSHRQAHQELSGVSKRKSIIRCTHLEKEAIIQKASWSLKTDLYIRSVFFRHFTPRARGYLQNTHKLCTSDSQTWQMGPKGIPQTLQHPKTLIGKGIVISVQNTKNRPLENHSTRGTRGPTCARQLFSIRTQQGESHIW